MGGDSARIRKILGQGGLGTGTKQAQTGMLRPSRAIGSRLFRRYGGQELSKLARGRRLPKEIRVSKAKNPNVISALQELKKHSGEAGLDPKNFLTERGIRSLDGENLRGEDLSGIKLDGVSLTGADLSEAVLVGASLNGAYLNNACLNLANMTDVQATRTSFRDAHLFGAILENANLSGAVFIRAWLCGARLSGANCSGANFDSSVLYWVNTRDTNFQSASFRGARIPFTAKKNFITN